jgi:hypothetical protein
MARKPIPKKTKLKIMYDSQYACVVCQKRGSHIHHIDQNNSNNDENNLVFLCTEHHDEAHTTHQLSQNLSSAALHDAKEKWLNEVQKKRELSSTLSGQLVITKDNPIASIGLSWGYINHKRVGQIVNPETLTEDEHDYFNYCVERGIIDKKGILIKPKNVAYSNSYITNTIYDWYEHGDDQRLHKVYSSFVDKISKSTCPIHLEAGKYDKEFVYEIVKPGMLLFLDKSFYFKNISKTSQNQHRKAHTTQGQIQIEFYLDTIDMFGTTSITISFSGHKSCAALLQLKSFEEVDNKLILHCTPIALGVGFNKQW